MFYFTFARKSSSNVEKRWIPSLLRQLMMQGQMPWPIPADTFCNSGGIYILDVCITY
jgi:hypothetical protein